MKYYPDVCNKSRVLITIIAFSIHLVGGTRLYIVGVGTRYKYPALNLHGPRKLGSPSYDNGVTSLFPVSRPTPLSRTCDMSR